MPPPPAGSPETHTEPPPSSASNTDFAETLDPALTTLIGPRPATNPQTWETAATTWATYQQQFATTPNPTSTHPPQDQQGPHNAVRQSVINARADAHRSVQPQKLATAVAALETKREQLRPIDRGVHSAGLDQLARNQPDAVSEQSSRPQTPNPGPWEAVETYRQHGLGHGTNQERQLSEVDFELEVINVIITNQATVNIDTVAARPYLEQALGQRPTAPDPFDETVTPEPWDQAAQTIEQYRIRHFGLTPHDGPANPQADITGAIGPRPTNPNTARTWDHLTQTANRLTIQNGPASHETLTIS